MNLPRYEPFPIVRRHGLVFVDTMIDQAFRRALMDGIPPPLRGKMREALAVVPSKEAQGHSVRYFGPKLADIKNRIAPLLIELNRFLSESRNLPGLFEWLDATNYGNDYRMIKAFLAWAEMAKTPSLGQVPTIIKPVALNA